MTYEEKLLEVFARYRGEALNEATLRQMEDACRKEVWAHLPLEIRGSWQLHLGFSDTSPPQVELHPRQTGHASAAELEAALRSTFREHSQDEPSGGIMSFSMNFSGDVQDPQDHPAEVAREGASVAAPPESSPVDPSKPTASRVPEAAAERGEPGGSGTTRASGQGSLGAELLAQAKSLGISLPSNSSLLGPFLDALSVAAEQKARADALEAKLRAILESAK
jgi:hypothetical protein